MNTMLPFPVYKEITIDTYKIVLLNWGAIPASSPYKNRNVLCFNAKDELVWQIEELLSYPGFQKECPFISVEEKNHQLILSNWCNLSLIVDYKTGEISSKEEVRW